MTKRINSAIGRLGHLARIICCSAVFLSGCASVTQSPEQPTAPSQAGAFPSLRISTTAPTYDNSSLARIEIPDQPPLAQAIDLTGNLDDLFQRMRHGFSMPDINDDLVLYHQQWYMNRPDYMRRMVDRSSRYLYHIVDELEKRGMPMELALLPMVESAYNPMAYSRSKASGLWQFIPATGKRFNLDQDWWKDERRDIVASTSAALDYLQTIYEMHGDWHLALASYNWGEGAVGRAIGKNRAQGLPTDYLSLTMPSETRNYVPKLQALKNIFRTPSLLAQLDLPAVPNRPFFATVTTDSHIDVKVAAKLAEMPVQEFVALNPAHNRAVIQSETPLVIPAEKMEAFVSNLEAHEDDNKPLSAWQTYTLNRGDTLAKVAKRFGMSVSNLKTVNGITGKVRVGPGQPLLVANRGIVKPEVEPENQLRDSKEKPKGQPTAKKSGTQKSVEKTPKVTRYTVRRGDTLYSIARQFKVETDDLLRWNRVSPQALKPGVTLTIQLAQNR